MTTKKPDIVHTIELITPELAGEYLSLNLNLNRPHAPAQIERYAKAMLGGKWHESAPTTPIAFDWDGNLINGQNRLRAIIKSGVSLHFPVEMGHDPESFAYIDIGKTRDASDHFAVMHKRQFGEIPKRHRYIASTANAMLTGLTVTSSSQRPEKLQVAEYAMQHRDQIQRFLGHLNKKTCHVFSTALVAAFANAALFLGSDTKLLEMAERLGTGVWSGPRDPMKALFDGLMKAMVPPAQRDAYSKHLERTEYYAYTVTAIRAALLDRHISRVEPTTQDWGHSANDAKIKRGVAA